MSNPPYIDQNSFIIFQIPYPKKPKESETKWDECPNLPYEVVQELWNERDPNIDYELKEDDFS